VPRSATHLIVLGRPAETDTEQYRGDTRAQPSAVSCSVAVALAGPRA
jgi:hypothetical protein